MSTLTANESKNQITGATISTIVHALLFALFFILSIPQPLPPTPAPPELGGILVALGEPDKGQGNDPAPQGQQMEDPSQTEVVPDPKPAAQKPAPTPSPAPAKTPAPKPTSTSPVTSEDPAAAVKRKQEEADRKKAKDAANAAADAKAKAQAAADAKAQATADAKAKADAAKGKYGDAFGKGKGSGQGKTGKPGNQGNPNGDPNSSNLEGMGGSGTVGGGLGNRKATRRPGKIVLSSNAAGKVVIDLCVNASGTVVSAKFKQGGSTTNNTVLVNAAIANAKQYEFDSTSAETQCGTVTYTFTPQ